MKTANSEHLSFTHAVAQLWPALGLAIPPADAMQSVSVDEHAVHVTECPESFMLMFTCIPPDHRVSSEQVNKQNAFSSDALKPIVAFDETTQQWLVWNRQPLSCCHPHTLVDQLEQLVGCSEHLVAS